MFDGILPKRLPAEMSAMKRRVSIADEALGIPDSERRAWDVFRASAVLNAQARGVVAEKVVRAVMGGDRVCSSEDRGDMLLNGRHCEIKSGFSSGKMNIRQVRPWQDADYVVIHVNVEDREACRAWRLTHDQMMAEVKKHGSVSHGTAGAVALNANKEYSLTISRGPRSAIGTRWDADYRDSALEALLFCPPPRLVDLVL